MARNDVMVDSRAAASRTLQVRTWISKSSHTHIRHLCNVRQTSFGDKTEKGNDSSFRIVSDSANSGANLLIPSYELSRNDRNSALSSL